MEVNQHLIPQLKHLRLSGILDTLEVRSRQALAEQWSYAEFLERLLEDEVERRQQKQWHHPCHLGTLVTATARRSGQRQDARDL